MKDISFFSEDKYLFLPSIRNPRVALTVSSAAKAKNAHMLYNPFSPKAKILKKTSQFSFTSLNALMTGIAPIVSHVKSDLIKHLENKFNTPFSASIYYATAKDKVVLQLQTKGSVFGYLKFPLNAFGIENITVEGKAIALLSERKIIAPIKDSGHYKDIPYIILPEIRGIIGNSSDNDIVHLANKFKKERKLRLKEHQRIKDLCCVLELSNHKAYGSIVADILKNSTEYYYEAFEHGDLTPWNIVKTNKGLVPFDFEFFIENGMEYLDLIKYHFQVGRLLLNKNHKDLTTYLFNKIRNNEAKLLISIFLILEIIRLEKINEPYDFHDNLLNHICE